MKNKKAVSVMVGYILLITFAIVLGGLTYQWLKTSIPRENIACPAETSLLVKDYSYDCTAQKLDLTLFNNGKFDIGGYNIKATNTTTQSLATIDLSPFWAGSKDNLLDTIVRFNPLDKNALKAGDTITLHVFNLPYQIYSIEVNPVRWQDYGRKERIVICGQAKIKEILTCD